MDFKRSPHNYLLKDEKVRAWVDDAARGSCISASVMPRKMEQVCRELDVNPPSLARMDLKGAGDFLLRVVSHLEKKGQARASRSPIGLRRLSPSLR